MIERKVILKNQTGLHARPASEVVTFAKQLPCKVYISHNGKKAAADSILQLLTLGAKEGSELMLSAAAFFPLWEIYTLQGSCFAKVTTSDAGRA